MVFNLSLLSTRTMITPTFTSTMAKRADVTGAPDQVYLQPSMVEFLVNGIRNKTVAGIGTIDNDTELKYIFNLQLHTSLDGTPLSIIGNASNIKYEFSLSKVNIEAIRYFTHVKLRNQFYPGQVLGTDDLTPALLAGTAWNNDTGLAASIMPNFFPVYYGQDPVYGELRDNDVMAEFSQLGPGYEHWGMAAIESQRDSENVLPAVDRIVAAGTQMTFLDPSWDPTKRKLASDNGPMGTIKPTQSFSYPQEKDSIGAFFQPVQPAAVQPAIGQTVNIMMPGEQEKEVNAMKGQAKLQLFMLGGLVNFEAGTIENLTYPIIAPAMNEVLSTARAARASSFTDLLNTAFNMAAGEDPTSIFSSQVSIKVIQTTAAASLLSGNFGRNRAQDYQHDSSTLDLSAFLPQLSPKIVESIMAEENAARNENMMELTDLQKAKPKTVIAKIGTMLDVDMFSSLCINFLTCISAICDTPAMQAAGSQCIFRQILMQYVLMVNGKFWKQWVTSVGKPMPHLPWTLYQFLEGSWLGLAEFAVHSTNVNVFMGNRPVTDLDTSGLTQAVSAVAACKNHFDRLFAIGAACTMVPRIIPASVRNAPIANSDHSASASAGGGTKRDGGATTNKSSDTAAAVAPVKRRRGAKSDSDPKALSKTGMGMFFVKPNLAAHEVFPPQLSEKLCVYFVCQGKECTRPPGQCPYKHAAGPTQLNIDDVKVIGDHFMKTGNGWFNKHHFDNFSALPVKYKCLVGDANAGMRCTAAECALPSSG